jgi:hypothetical protein
MLRSLIVLVLTALAGTALANEPLFPPGSRIGLAPPKDMELSKRFAGFENPDKGASITLFEMPPEAYPKLAAGLNAKALKQQGVRVTSREELKLGDRTALLIGGDQTSGKVTIRKWLLATADPTITALVIAQAVSSKGGYTEEQMRDALKSVALRAPVALEDQVAALPFRLGDRAGFRPVRVAGGNSLLMTDGPQDAAKDLEQPLLVLTLSNIPVPPAGEARDTFARAALTSNPGLKDIAVERSQAFRQRGADWHEIVARATDRTSGLPIVAMQTIRFGPNGTLRLLGLVRADARDQVLPRFRAVIDGVEAD